MPERKPLDPALRRFLDEQAAASDGPIRTPDQARQRLDRALAIRSTIPGLPNSVESEDIGLAPAIEGRLYIPLDAGTPSPVLVYLHGGGWVAGSIATHDPFCRLLSEAAGVMVLSVDYRRAPEFPYPDALGDTLVAVRWAMEHIENYEGDPTRVALGGDSAGANLAAVAASRLATMPQIHPLRALMLLFPITDHPSGNHPSYTENATGYGLEADSMSWYWNQYAADASPDDPDLSPLRATQIPQLPPTLVATAEYDILRDEGIAYAEKLRGAGVKVTHLHTPDMHHDFPANPGTVARFRQSTQTLTEIAEWLRSTLKRA